MGKAFQIHNANDEAISINTLDTEAAAFWGKEVHKKNYATPIKPKEGEDEESVSYILKEMRGNWYDIIGHNIAYQGHECSGWANVVATMIATNIGMKFIDTSEGYKERPVSVKFDDKVMLQLYCTLDYYKPYIELINHWQSKGYKPVQIKE